VTWIIALLVFPVLAYLVGSVPFGYIAGRLNGLDIRKHGSCNVGATNVGRLLGRRWGLTVFAADVLKGAIPSFIAARCLETWLGLTGPTMFAVWMVSAFGAIAGHVWPIWLKLRGGKGVATSLGVVLALYPFFTWPGLAALAAWIVVTLISRYVSLGSIIAAGVFIVTLVAMSLAIGGAWSPGEIWPLLIFAALMAALVVLRHRGNISRLLAGTENKIGQPRHQ
jgi:glycerol-3-phosphate acyltransferase PlsY